MATSAVRLAGNTKEKPMNVYRGQTIMRAGNGYAKQSLVRPTTPIEARSVGVKRTPFQGFFNQRQSANIAASANPLKTGTGTLPGIGALLRGNKPGLVTTHATLLPDSGLTIPPGADTNALALVTPSGDATTISGSGATGTTATADTASQEQKKGGMKTFLLVGAALVVGFVLFKYWQ